VGEGELLAVLGHNGAGKSTLLKAVAGTLPIREGRLTVGGEDLTHSTVGRRLAAGVVYLPQGNPVFSQLSVSENLALRVPAGASRRELGMAVERAVEAFPQLAGRRRQIAGSLSGGEKQMLSLAGALLSRPRFLLLDEPCLGLSPSLVTSALDRFKQLVSESGVGIILVEQKIREVLRVCGRVIVMRQGAVVLDGANDGIVGDEARLRELCL
jgi:branched-chain amino acid transport system ATP-binding protein